MAFDSIVSGEKSGAIISLDSFFQITLNWLLTQFIFTFTRYKSRYAPILFNSNKPGRAKRCALLFRCAVTSLKEVVSVRPSRVIFEGEKFAY